MVSQKSNFFNKTIKCNIEYQLYQQNLVNNIVNHNKYQELKCGEGYNFLSEKGFNDYLSKHIYYYTYPNLQTKSCENIRDYRNRKNPIKAFEERIPIYKAFHQVYYEACFSSRIINKINQVKQSSLEAKVNNMVAKFQQTYFQICLLVKEKNYILEKIFYKFIIQ